MQSCTGVSLTLCCFVVYSTRLFVLCLTLCYFALVFFSPFSIAITSLREERANLSAFRTFVRFALVWFCLFSLPLGVLEGLLSEKKTLKDYEIFMHIAQGQGQITRRTKV